MKSIKIISVLFLIASMNMSCSCKDMKDENTSVNKAAGVQVYYFHLARS